MGENEKTSAPVTLVRGRNTTRLINLGSKIIAQRFDGDPWHAGTYLGMVTYHPPKTVEQIAADYEKRGWTRTETPAGA